MQKLITLMSDKPKSSYEIAAEKMLLEGAERVEAGTTVPLRPNYRVRITSGWAAWDREKGRLVCTGKVRIDATGDSVPLVIEQLARAAAKDWERAYIIGELDPK